MVRIKKRAKRKILVVSLGIILLLSSVPGVDASVLNQKRSELRNIEQKINQYRQESQAKAGQVHSLNNQLEVLDAELRETELGIEKINAEIEVTDMEIAEITDEIMRAENEKKANQEKLKQAIRIKYSQGEIEITEVLASSRSLSDFINIEAYMQALQQRINDTVKRIKELEAQLKIKKQELENKRQQQERLRSEQEVMKYSLDNQIAAKNSLLEQTKGEQERYNNLLAHSLRDKNNVNAQIAKLTAVPKKVNNPSPSAINIPKPSSSVPSGSSRYVAFGHINVGDIIGYQGNTGFSTGSHLHFGLYKNGQDVDPMPYLANGYISWPLNGRITQGYWGTFSHRGRGWPGGIDIVSYHGAPIRAAHSGTIIFRGGNATSGFGHYVIINHGDGFTSLYAHLI